MPMESMVFQSIPWIAYTTVPAKENIDIQSIERNGPMFIVSHNYVNYIFKNFQLKDGGKI
ncbi:hypothetical protein BLOT_010268 [Blomia tropicalis]|nr:hypothetical protein BLOT_010268 [Blomia tropicalis]